MRMVQSATLIGFLATLVLTSTAALAVELDASVDKRIVAPGGTLTVTASVTDDDGNAGNFDYRIAVIAPGRSDGGERIIVCDSGKLNTGGSANVSFDCQIPTLEGLQELGVDNAAERAVIPLRGGIAVRDPATNESEKEHGKALIINTDKFRVRFEEALTRIDAFISRAQELIARCDNITARAEEAGAERVIERCANFQEKVQEKIDKAVQAQERINNALAKLDDPSTLNFDDLKNAFVNFRNGARDFKVDTKDLREFVERSRADLEKRVTREIADQARERTKEIRENLKIEQRKLEDRLKELRKNVIDRKEGRTVATTETSESSGSSEPSGGSGSGETSGSSSGSGSSGSGG